VTIPHSGEQIPAQAQWLQGLDEVTLMCDVDRYVDRLYEPILNRLKIPLVKTQWHRYCADLNRLPSDIDEDSVEACTNKSGTYSRGFLWVKTTLNKKLLTQPISKKIYSELVALIHDPFHQQVLAMKNKAQLASSVVLHLDLHSMPSMGTSEHRDPGEKRADVVVSDSKGKSADKKYVDLVVNAYKAQGFSVSYNWPYYGGRLTEAYGRPEAGHHTIQIELNRSLYMDEVSKKWLPEKALDTQSKLSASIEAIFAGLKVAL
jgi:N-formylglutamate amidohydrolase